MATREYNGDDDDGEAADRHILPTEALPAFLPPLSSSQPPGYKLEILNSIHSLTPSA
jgi:hypothetical protein